MHVNKLFYYANKRGNTCYKFHVLNFLINGFVRQREKTPKQ